WWRSARVRTTDAAAPGADPTPFSTATLLAPVAAGLAVLAWTWPHLFRATRLWVWDDYTYHMVYPTLWLRDHAVAAVSPAEAFTMQAWYPLSASVIAAWFMAPFAASRADALAWVSLTGVLYAGIVTVGAAELLARLGCRRGAWAVPVILFATSRRIDVMASSFSDADLAVAAALFGAIVFATPRGEAEGPREVAGDAAYAALLTGIALGVKVSAAPVALIVLGMAAVRARSAAPAAAARWRALGCTAAVFIAGWTVTAGYWYARNVVHTGNPVYPAAFLVWPGVTFPETTLVEYARRYGLRRALGDALAVYANWPAVHAALAAAGVVGLAGWLVLGRRTGRTRRFFACATLVLVATVLALLPGAPYSAGNALTFRSGFVHWDSMRYVALVPILGWTALGFLIDAGAGAPWWRSLAALVVAGAALTTLTPAALGLGVVATVAAAWLLARTSRRPAWLGTRRGRGLAIAAVALAVVTLPVWAHGRKAAATAAAFLGDPLFGGPSAVLDRQSPGTRVAVFGDQWIYPTFGDRHHLRPVRLDGAGRIATAPIGGAMAPEWLTVDPRTFRANLRASGVGLVVVVRQPHPGRGPDLPPHHAALEAASDTSLLYRDRAVAVWRLDP
ncbi:MAG TPA: hypothetical protein VGJ70_22195, partial [Solirubrobacteraceae bacterium]